MSRQEILNMLGRQAAYDSGAGGALIGGARSRKKATKKVRMARSKSAGGRKKTSMAHLTRKMAAAGLLNRPRGRGVLGGVSYDDPIYNAQRKQLIKKLRDIGSIASADYGAPYDPLLEGEDELTNAELAAYIQELEQRAVPSQTLRNWRAQRSALGKIKKAAPYFSKLLSGESVGPLRTGEFATPEAIQAVKALERAYRRVPAEVLVAAEGL